MFRTLLVMGVGRYAKECDVCQGVQHQGRNPRTTLVEQNVGTIATRRNDRNDTGMEGLLDYFVKWETANALKNQISPELECMFIAT